ncbi:MAG: lytic transglycosylase domain-containing protein [Bilophila wadsworthia]
MRAVGPDGVARLAERYAGQHGVEPRLVMAIIKVESGFDAKAVSSAGASGLMQLMPGTQRHLGVRDAFNPDENVEGGVRYFRSMLDRYGGNVSLALAAYNAGPANVDKYGGILFEETRNYVESACAVRYPVMNRSTSRGFPDRRGCTKAPRLRNGPNGWALRGSFAHQAGDEQEGGEAETPATSVISAGRGARMTPSMSMSLTRRTPCRPRRAGD